MPENKIKEEVKNIFVESFPELRREKFNFNKKQSDFKDWDSFMHMKLISMMEEKFDVKLAMERTIDADSPMKFIEIIKDSVSARDPGSVHAVSAVGGCKNFPEILDYWAAHAPDKTFIVSISADTSYSYSHFNRLVNSCGRFLKKQGVKKGDIVLLCVRNSVEFLIVYFATMRIGGVINILPTSIADEELSANIAYLKPRLAFVDKKYSRSITKRKNVFQMEFEGKNGFLKILDGMPDDALAISLKENDAACLYYSSGTTANPKGILFSHRGIVNMAILLCREFGHNQKSVHLGILPMGHTSVMHHSLLPVLYAGGTFVFSENFISVRKNFWHIIEDYKVSYVQTVPTIIVMTLNTPYSEYRRKGLPLQFIACGSAPLPDASKRAFEKKFGLRIANLYGLSEATHVIDNYPFEDSWKPGMLGRPMKDVDVKIFDEAGKEVATGVTGEFAVKTPSLFMGYFKDKKLTESSFKRGYFCTGDLGYKDRKGIFYYAGRKKDLIIKGGVNISPDLIDEILLKHSKIAEAASVGKNDTLFGEVVKSFVVLRPGKKMPTHEFFSYCKGRLGEFKSPSEVEFVKEIPKTFSGKILRRTLRQRKS